MNTRGQKALGLALIIGPLLGAVVWQGNRDLMQVRSVAEALPQVLVLWVALCAAIVGVVLLSHACGEARSLNHPRRWRAALLMLVVASLGSVLALIGGISDKYQGTDDLATELTVLFLAFGGYGIGLGMWLLWRRMQRLDAWTTQEALHQDPRAPVLYLRAFQEDGKTAMSAVMSSWKAKLYEIVQAATPEQELARLLDVVGPMVAIGKPGEPLPELGAYRMYVDHDRWQSVVLDLMNSAALVVMRVGASAGVSWELEQMLAHVPRQRLLLLILAGQAPHPDAQELLRNAVGDGPWNQAGATDGAWGWLVGFDAQGRPVTAAVRPQPPTLWRAYQDGLRPWALPLKKAWEDWCSATGRAVGPPKRKRSQVLAFGLAMTFGMVGLHWWYVGRHRLAIAHAATLSLIFVPEPPMWLMVAYALVSLLAAGWLIGIHMVWIGRSSFERLYVR